MLGRFRCWWDGFAGTWLDPGMWMTRFRLLLTTGAFPVAWPGIVYSGHLHDTGNPRFVVEGDKEHEYMRCVRCQRELYMGWRHYLGV